MTAQEKNGTPLYLSRDPSDPIRMAQEARAQKAAQRKDLTPREQQLQWGREKFTEVSVAMRHGQRRTLLGFVQNAAEVRPDEKHALCDAIQADLDFIRNSIPAEGESTAAIRQAIPLPF